MRITIIVIVIALIGCDRTDEGRTEQAGEPRTEVDESASELTTEGVVFTPGSTNSRIHEYLASHRPSGEKKTVSNTVKFEAYRQRSFAELFSWDAPPDPKYLDKILNATRGATSMTDRKRAAKRERYPDGFTGMEPRFDLEAPVSPIGLNDDGKKLLHKNGFAIVPQSERSFLKGYEFVFINDLPVFITADAIMHAVYRSYEKIFDELETQVLQPRLHQLLSAMHNEESFAKLHRFDRQTINDVDFYLTIARSLLERDPKPISHRTHRPQEHAPLVPLRRDNSERVQRYWEYIAAERPRRVRLFGSPRVVDFGSSRKDGMIIDRVTGG